MFAVCLIPRRSQGGKAICRRYEHLDCVRKRFAKRMRVFTNISHIAAGIADSMNCRYRLYNSRYDKCRGAVGMIEASKYDKSYGRHISYNRRCNERYDKYKGRSSRYNRMYHLGYTSSYDTYIVDVVICIEIVEMAIVAKHV